MMKRFVGKEVKMALIMVPLVLAANALIGGGTVGFYVLCGIGLFLGVELFEHPKWLGDSRFARWLNR